MLRASILLLFAMLWLPLGQTGFLVEHWMKLGVFAVPFLGIGIYAYARPETGLDLRGIGFLMLIAYIAHQFEEHWVDLYGNVYAFYTFNNEFILAALGASGSAVRPLTPESIYVINTALVWLVGLIAIERSPNALLTLFAMAGIIVVNGVVHIAAGLATLSYNPGLLTSALLFLPLYGWFLSRFRDERRLIVVGLVWALLAHALMVGGLLAANWFGWIPESVYWLALVVWSIVPGLVAWSSSAKP